MSVPDTAPTLLVVGSDAPGTGDASALLDAADVVFAGAPGPEAAALFYAEAWRVERTDPLTAAARLDEWFDACPSGTAALVVAGRVDDDVAFRAALDGLAFLRPGLRVRRCTDVAVTPPERTRLVS